MKRIIYYILFITSIMCLQLRNVVAGSYIELTSESSGLSADGTTAGWSVVRLEDESANRGEKSSAGTNTALTDADMSAGLVGNDGGSNEALYTSKVVPPTNTIDVIIHAIGGTYVFKVNGQSTGGDHRVLAGWLKSKGYNTKTIRLLSCSDLNSAQHLSNKLNQPVIATDGYVCIYSDGGLSVVPRTSNGDTKWYLLKPNATRIEAASPRAPGSPTLDYVQMGGSKSKLVSSLNLGTFVRKYGQYDVYQNGEVFYRAMNQADFDYLVSTGKIKVPVNADGTITSEMFTSPTLAYIQDSPYLEGTIIVKFQMKPGTIDKLKAIGTVKSSDVGKPLMVDFGNLPINQSGWMQNNTLFKIEGTQVNIGLGRNGKGMEIFNSEGQILFFQRVN